MAYDDQQSEASFGGMQTAQLPVMEQGGPLGQPKDDEKKEGYGEDAQDETSLREKAFVKQWLDRIEKAEKRWEPDFERMRCNMDFVSGLQWAGQRNLTEEERYIVNLTLRAINQGVATIYARDPRVEARRRKRLDFKLWDGNMETIIQAMLAAKGAQFIGQPVPPEVMGVMNDFQMGRMREKLVERVGKTLEKVFQYQMDTQEPDFKLQMKQLVRRVRVCGVGYIKVIFCRKYESELTQSETRMSLTDRVKIAARIIEKLQKGEMEEVDPEVEKLKNLVQSFGMAPLDSEAISIDEHLIFDFPTATSIIPDPQIRNLKGFVGAKWIAERMYYPVDFVNAVLDCDIKPDETLSLYGRDGKPYEAGEAAMPLGQLQDSKQRNVCIYTVYDLDTKTTFTLAKGYKTYVEQPQPLTPATRGFWDVFPVTFNDVETEIGCKASIFPPSDVDLLRPIQKERNRSRQALRRHRKANSPRYMYPDGSLAEEDLDLIENSEDQQFIKLKGIQPGAKPADVLQPLAVAPINPEVYETRSLDEDMLLATGQQQANVGPAQPNVTATVGTIAEQSRMSVASSDVDGLDDSLTQVAKCGGEMLLREMSAQTVQRIVGPGAVWPDTVETKESFINEIDLEVVAASSGRPNKAMDIANWQQIAPILQAAGANPQAIIRETVRRLDDRLEVADFFPLPVPTMAPPPQGGPRGPSGATPQPNNGKQQMNPAQQQPRQPTNA